MSLLRLTRFFYIKASLLFSACGLYLVPSIVGESIVSVCFTHDGVRGCIGIPSDGTSLKKAAKQLAAHFPNLDSIFGVREGGAILPLQWVIQRPNAFEGMYLELVPDSSRSFSPELIQVQEVWNAIQSGHDEDLIAFRGKLLRQLEFKGAFLLEVPALWGSLVSNVSHLGAKFFDYSSTEKEKGTHNDPESGYFHGWAQQRFSEYIQIRAKAERQPVSLSGTPRGFNSAAFKLFLRFHNVSMSIYRALLYGMNASKDHRNLEQTFGHPLKRLGVGQLSENYYRILHYPQNAGRCSMKAHADVGPITVSPLVSRYGLEALQPETIMQLAVPVRTWEWHSFEGLQRPEIWLVYIGEIARNMFGEQLWPLFHRVCFRENTSLARFSLPFFQRLHGDAQVSVGGKSIRMWQFFQQLKTRSYNRVEDLADGGHAKSNTWERMLFRSTKGRRVRIEAADEAIKVMWQNPDNGQEVEVMRVGANHHQSLETFVGQEFVFKTESDDVVQSYAVEKEPKEQNVKLHQMKVAHQEM